MTKNNRQQNRGKRLLSLLLAMIMVLSTFVSAYGLDNASTPADGSSRELALTPMDPAELSVPKLGETDEPSDGETEDFLYHADDIVRVSIVLKDPSTVGRGYEVKGIADNTSAMAYRENLLRKQEAITAAIEKELGTKLDVKWNLALLVNIISADVRYKDIPRIEMVDGVDHVSIEHWFQPETAVENDLHTAITTKDMISATNVWANGYTGAGMRIAVLDTGIEDEHRSFDSGALEYAFEQNARDAGMTLDEYKQSIDLLTPEELSSVKLNALGVYCTEKVPYGYNYADGNSYQLDHQNDTQTEHGSHVSGIAAANRFVKDADGNYVDAVSEVLAVGVAPDAQILNMKVFGKLGSPDSTIVSAIEDAILLKADAINMSLGSTVAGYTFHSDYEVVMQELAEYNATLSVSAGNSYAWSHFLSEHESLYREDVNFDTVSSPGSVANSLTVASADNIGTTGMPLVFGDRNVFYKEAEAENAAKMADIAGTYEYVYLDSVGTPEEWAAISSVGLQGKVLICNRGGQIEFPTKAQTASKYNPKVFVVANTVEGLINMATTGYTGTAPMISISRTDAVAIQEYSTKGTLNGLTYYTGTVEVQDVIETGVNKDLADATISVFSSWGVPGSLELKPEITAPGGSIYSVNGMNTTGYELMSGTSMAAPQVSGMAALMNQYVEAQDLTEKSGGYTERQLTQSLLMSTAVPMKENGEYYPVLRQGAGLANVGAAVSAKSFITMESDATASWQDGKVKAEVGENAARDGAYSYSFTIHNLSDQALSYDLSTDLFTQDQDGTWLLPTTTGLNAVVTYDYEGQTAAANEHDVNKDGTTNTADAQAILDYLTGNVSADKLDLAVGEMDKDNKLTTNDAYELLKWLEDQGGAQEGGLVVPANGTKKVTVNIQLTDLDALNNNYPRGAYVEGYTFVTCTSQSKDGEILDSAHSIPILGFYGSWTDPGMLDNNNAVDALYHTNDKIPYTGHTDTNCLTVRYSGSTEDVIYTGNPYLPEESFPVERLAVNSSTILYQMKYSLIRNAAFMGVLFLGENGQILDSKAIDSFRDQPYYVISDLEWSGFTPRNAYLGKTVSSLNLSEGSAFSVNFYAVPEYYGLQLSNHTTSRINIDQLQELVKNGKLGVGAGYGYTLTIDNTKPVIESAVKNEDGTVTVTAFDDRYIACLAVKSTNGSVTYGQVIPEQTAAGQKVSYTFDLSGQYLDSKVAIFAADYAGNETADTVQISEERQDAYVPTNTLEAGQEYLVVDRNTAGEGHVLTRNGSAVTSTAITVNSDENGVYIVLKDAPAEAKMTATAKSGKITFKNGSYRNALGITYAGTGMAFTSNYGPAYMAYEHDAGGLKGTRDGASEYSYLYFNGENFAVMTTAPESTNRVYLFVKVGADSNAVAEPAEEIVPEIDVTAVDTAERAETAEPAVENEVVVEDDFGGLHAVRGTISQPQTATVQGPDADKTATVTLSEAKKTNNGLYEVTYDTTKLTYAGAASDVAYQSVNVDEEKGVITFAFADLEAVAENAVIATFRFTVASCEDVTVTAVTKERNTELDLTEKTELTVTGIGHDWGEPTYEWTETAEGYTVTATAVCKNDASHVETETVTATYEVTVEPTTESEGTGVYTAKFTKELFTEQTKEVTIPKLPITGYHILVTNYTKGAATTDVDAEKLYSGEVTFTVTAETACVVAIDKGDGTYQRLSCTEKDGAHQFTVTVTNADVKLVVVLRGDADLNGSLRQKDATLVRQVVAGNTTFTENEALQILAVDLNNDGVAQQREATMISQVVAGNNQYKW